MELTLLSSTVPLAGDHHGSRKCLPGSPASFVPCRPTRVPVACGRCGRRVADSRRLTACLTGRVPILRRRLLPGDPLPDRLPLQATQGQLHHADLSPQHQLQRQHLPRHSARPMEPGSDYLQRCVPAARSRAQTPLWPHTLPGASRADQTWIRSPTVYLLHADGPQPR